MQKKSDREGLINRVITASKQVAVAAQAQVMPSWVALDITMAQLKAMFILEQHGSLTVSQLADALEIGRSAASLLVDHLVSDHFVERAEDAQDRRRSLLQLSPRGQEVVHHLWQVRQVQRNWLEKLSQSDLEALDRGLRALAAVAEQEARALAVTDVPAGRKHVTDDIPPC